MGAVFSYPKSTVAVLGIGSMCFGMLALRVLHSPPAEQGVPPFLQLTGR